MVVAIGLLIFYYFFKRQSPSEEVALQTAPRGNEVNLSQSNAPEPYIDMLTKTFNDFGLRPEWVNEKGKTIEVKLPEEVITVVMVHRLISESREHGWKINSSHEDISKKRTVLELRGRDDDVRKLVFLTDPDLHINQGKIAIIIDDLGYANHEEVNKLFTTSSKITLSILPGIAQSKLMYGKAIDHNKETLIHLPMEAELEKVDYTDYTIYTQMSENEIRSRIRKAIMDYPASNGINNHMGSKITSDEKIMAIIVDELKKNQKFFIDSRTTDTSVAYKVARNLNLPTAENNLFLDQSANDTEEYLVKKFEALAKIANARGSAIGIGHTHKGTIKVLLEQIPQFEKRGYEFVYVSEILMNQ